MNQWRIYSYMKTSWLEKGHVPMQKEIVSHFPEATFHEVKEGMVEFQIAYDRAWSRVEPYEKVMRHGFSADC